MTGEKDLGPWEEGLGDVNLEPNDDIAYEDPIKRAFERKRRLFKESDPEEHDHFLGELMLWGSCIPHPGTLGDVFKEQVEFQAKRRGITPLEFVDYLFTPPTEGKLAAETIMLRLQL